MKKAVFLFLLISILGMLRVQQAVWNIGIKNGGGDRFEIIAGGASRINKYIQSAKLNGKPLYSFHFPAKELLNGGTLELQMGPEPEKE